jgi:uncharacterized protein
MIKLTARDNTITFAVRVQPRASQTMIVGELDGALKLRLAAPPVDGAANEELIRWLAKFFDVPRAAIEILSGATAKQKLIRVSGVQPAAAEQKLNAILAQS